jgi:hypothetical protein
MSHCVRAFPFVLLLASSGAPAGEPGSDLQRLQIQRDQQQLELGLKMQQQQERAMRPAPNPALELQRRQFERDQLQRQQQFFDEQTRATIAPAPAADLGGGRARAAQSAAESTGRLEAEQRTQPAAPQPPSTGVSR